MTPEEFRIEFLETVRAVAAAEDDFIPSAFISVATRNLEDAGEIADFERCHFRGVGPRKRGLWVDGYAFDDADGSARLLVADWRGENVAETMTHTEAATTLNRVRAFVEEAQTGNLHQQLEESTEAHSLAKELYQRGASIGRYRIFLITDSLLSTRVRDWPEGAINGTPVEFHIWDISRLHRVFESKSGQEELDVDLTAYQESGIPCLAASVESEQYKAFLCVVSGEALAKLYDNFGSRLLEGNVRSFLSAKGKVNKGIQATIRAEREMFFAYNNGIAATASEATVQESPKGMKLLRAKDLQIVNGGQTTASLATAMRIDKADLSGIFVQMKLSVIPAEKSGEVIPRIAKYANSQNKVSDADFFSNHEFHRRMEQISRRLIAPAVRGAQHGTHWFYERARGQYLNEQSRMTKAEKGRFLVQNPREQVIAKTDLAKTENAWRRIPNVVSRGAQKNFIAFADWIGGLWDTQDSEFNEAYFRMVVVRTILYRSAERLVTKQPWYQGGYRANIVAYAVSKLASQLGSGSAEFDLDYDSIWAKQVLSKAAERQLILNAESVFDVLVHPPTGFQNVTEWSKRDQCWKQIEALDVELLPEFRKELASSAETKRRQREATEIQEGDNRINAQIAVVELGRNYWTAMLRWSKGKNLLSGEEEKLLGLAIRMPVVMPTERQSSKLLEMKKRMEEEGFRAK